jgi:hypothetical protein
VRFVPFGIGPSERDAQIDEVRPGLVRDRLDRVDERVGDRIRGIDVRATVRLGVATAEKRDRS